MKKEEAKNLVVKTFEKSFDESRFLYFIKNLLNGLDESKTQVWAGKYIPESYRAAIQSYKRIGQYTDNKNNIIDVLTVNVKRDNTLERARTLQRNFIGRHLKQRNREAALVAFYTEEFEDWRFSLVLMELSLTKTKVEIELSPAKRYSFLVGKNERSHTAQNQFVNLLIDKNEKHTLDAIEQAFNIETVTKEFFLEYRDLFIRTKTSLDKILNDDAKVKIEFDNKGIDSVNFSKKLLGQIVFLYFLQKKGWFGVGKNEKWGAGSKKFLRELFESKHGRYNNFYNNILEPLFYEALRIDRSYDDHYYSRFDCKIPFLNGGLFDPIGDYSWVQTDITLPNDLFSNNNKTSAGDVGNGIIDIFDRYNFTVIEDEPLEKEVAIDPELLGKAYEKFNAIRPDNFDEYLKVLKGGKKGEETKFNKQYGVYYTPREIVHYMCRESLINYLASEFSDKSDAYQKIELEQLDAFGNTSRKGQLPLETEYKSLPHIPKSDIETLINYGEMFGENEAVVESKGKETDTYYYKLSESIRKNSHLIDDKLANILICDPAVGSGAFPVGMMHEIVSTRNILSIFIKDNLRTKYHFKRECIENSLYGVDVDAGAVEIAKLRLWLSLVVDEEDINNIKPLPNLDYKIIKGNSLIGFPSGVVKNIGIEKEIEALKIKYFDTTDVNEKRKLKDDIELNISKLVEEAKHFSDKILDVSFDFEFYFSEVFHTKKGFDIVIANPPYIRQELITGVKKNLETYFVYSGRADLYVYFFEKAIRDLLSKNGILCFITSNKWLRAQYGFGLRSYLAKFCKPLTLIDFGELPVFQDASTFPLIFVGSLKELSNKIFTQVTSLQFPYPNITQIVSESGVNISDYNFTSATWTFSNNAEDKILLKINSCHNRIDNSLIMAGIKTGLNAAFWLDQSQYENFIFADPKCSNFLKPLLVGDDIRKWGINKKNRWLIYTPIGTEIEALGPLSDHLKVWKTKLENRALNQEWWELQQAQQRYSSLFEQPKIIYPDIAKSPRFTIDYEKYYLDMTAFSIYSDSKYLLGLLNSKLIWFYLQKTAAVLGDANKGGRLRLKRQYIKDIPIPKNNKVLELKISENVEKILSLNKSKLDSQITSLENQIDILVYKLYNFTYEEVKTIDPNIGEIISEEEYEKFEIK